MSNSPGADVPGCLAPRPGVNALVAIGSPLRGDDGVGPYIAAGLSSTERWNVFDAGTNPENIVDAVIALRPCYVLFIDAADFGGEPGQARVIDKEQVSDTAVSTHMFPLRAVWELVERETNAEIRCVGIQPLDCSFREGLSADVRAAAEKIVGELIHMKHRK
jgi:hydrogenase 3 maturation protease